MLGGRYRVERILAQGATARLVSAVDEASGKPVCLKLLEPHFAAHGLVRARFEREMRAVAALDCEHVHRVLELGLDEEGCPYAVLEALEGQNLEACRESAGGRLPPELLRPVARAAAEGLRAAHREGFVHRDVQPRHLWLGLDGAWKVGDFGMASVDGAVGLTSNSLVLGAPVYLAPEIFGSSVVDARADVYGLGVTLYECLAGAPPWPTGYAGELLRLKLTEAPPRLPEPIAALDPGLARLVERAMASRPADRFASMDELLRELAGSGGLGLVEAPAAERRRLCPNCGAARELDVALCLECGASDEERAELEDPSLVVLEELRAEGAELEPIARVLASVSDVDADRMLERLQKVRGRLPRVLVGSLRPRAAEALCGRLASMRCRVAAYRQGPALDALMTGGRGLLLTTIFVLGEVVLPLAVAVNFNPALGFGLAGLMLILFKMHQRTLYQWMSLSLRPLLGGVRGHSAPALPASVVRSYREALSMVRGSEVREALRRALKRASRLLGLLDAGLGMAPGPRSELRRDLEQMLVQSCALAVRVDGLDRELAAFEPRRAFDRLELLERSLAETGSALEAEQLLFEKRQLEALFERSSADERLRASAMARLLELVGKLEEWSSRLLVQPGAVDMGAALRSFNEEISARLSAVEELGGAAGALSPHPHQRAGLRLRSATGPLDTQELKLLRKKNLGVQGAQPPGGVRGGAPISDRFTIVGELGRGGIAVVYLAEDRVLGRQVAVKLVASSGDSLGLHRERLRQELEAARRLEDPRVVRVYELLEEPDRLSLVMEYVAGPDLKRVLAQAGGRLPAEEVLHVARECLHALAAAHRLGIVHGDVKPHNLLRAPDGRVKLTDFGMARLESELSLATGSLLIGTPEYTAPEALSGEAFDHRADLYSLGVTLYELATGRLPHQGRSPFELLHAQAEARVVPPRDLAPGLPEFLERVILTSMAKEVDERFQSAEEMLAALESRLPVLAAGSAPARVSEMGLCLACQAEIPIGSPVCWSCGAAPAALPQGDSMLVLTSTGSLGAAEATRELSLLDASCVLEEQPPMAWSLLSLRYDSALAGMFCEELRKRGYEARHGFSPLLAWSGVLSTPEEKQKVGRVSLALAAAYSVLGWGVFGSVWPQIGASLAAGLAAYWAAPAFLARAAGWLLEPVMAAYRRPALLDRLARFQSVSVVEYGSSPGWQAVAVAPPAGGWTISSWARLRKDVAEATPCGSLKDLTGARPKPLLRGVEPSLARRLGEALRRRGLGVEVRSIHGRNEDLVNNWVLSVPAGIPGAALGLMLVGALRRYLPVVSEFLAFALAGSLPFYAAYFSRRGILRLAGAVAGRLRRPMLTVKPEAAVAVKLPEDLAQGYALLLERTQGARLQRQVQRLMRRALRLLPRLDAMDREWFGEGSGRAELESLMRQSLGIAERVRQFDAFQADHPEMEGLARVLELERALLQPLESGARDRLESMLEAARGALRRHAEVDRERRRLGSCLSRVSGALASLEERLETALPGALSSGSSLLLQALSEVAAQKGEETGACS